LSSAAITFDASFETTGATDEELALDWIESGDVDGYVNGVCDKFYYDAETLDVPVHRAAEVMVDAFSTPWNEFVGATPTIVFYRDTPRSTSSSAGTFSRRSSTNFRSAVWMVVLTPSPAAERWSGDRATLRTRSTATSATPCRRVIS
jgi:hypothetical protein